MLTSLIKNWKKTVACTVIHQRDLKPLGSEIKGRDGISKFNFKEDVDKPIPHASRGK